MITIFKKVNTSAKSTTICTYYEVVKYNNKRFKIYIEFSNGTMLGFNSKCCVAVLNDNGSWDKVVDNRQLGIECCNDLYYSHSQTEKVREFDKVANQFKDYIKAVY